ncbi:MAG: hypothetical protein V3W43_16055, partial [Desulfatiglandaceae bacterium]
LQDHGNGVLGALVGAKTAPFAIEQVYNRSLGGRIHCNGLVRSDELAGLAPLAQVIPPAMASTTVACPPSRAQARRAGDSLIHFET